MDLNRLSKAELVRLVVNHPGFIWSAHHPRTWRKEELISTYRELTATR